MIHMIEMHPGSRYEMVSELFRLYGKLMYDVAYSVLKHEQNAEDVVQETLLKLIEKSDQFEQFVPQKMRRFIIVMTRNTALDFRRRQQRNIAVDMNEEENQSVLSLVSSDEDIFQARELAASFRQLDEDEQDLLWMKYWERQTSRQIAARLHISEAAAVSRLRRAKEHLKELYLNGGESGGSVSV